MLLHREKEKCVAFRFPLERRTVHNTDIRVDFRIVELIQSHYILLFLSSLFSVVGSLNIVLSHRLSFRGWLWK